MSIEKISCDVNCKNYGCKLQVNGFPDLCPLIKERIARIITPVPTTAQGPEPDPNELNLSWEVIDPKTFRHITKSMSLLRLPRKEFPEKTRFPAVFPPGPDALTGGLVERSRGVHSYSYSKMIKHEEALRNKAVTLARSTVSGWIPEEGLESKHELPTTTLDYVAYKQEDAPETEEFNPETMVSMAESVRKFRLQDAGVVRVRRLKGFKTVYGTLFERRIERFWNLQNGSFRPSEIEVVNRVRSSERIPVYEMIEVPSYRPVGVSKEEVLISGVTEVTRAERRERLNKGMARRLERSKGRDRVKLDKLEYMIKTGQVHFR